MKPPGPPPPDEPDLRLLASKMAARRPPKQTRSDLPVLLEQLLQGLRPPGSTRAPPPFRLLQHWETLVGAFVAQHAQPQRVWGGTLEVKADSIALQHEIERLSPEIVERAQRLGLREVQRLVVTGPPARKRKGSASRKGGPDATPTPFPAENDGPAREVRSASVVSRKGQKVGNPGAPKSSQPVHPPIDLPPEAAAIRPELRESLGRLYLAAHARDKKGGEE